MVSPRGQSLASPLPPTATSVGEITVREYGYGLGPPTGILVLHYPAAPTAADFPEGRDDFLHQVFWSPDGVLLARRGETARFVSAHQMLWVRSGVVIEVQGLGSQAVLRACVRQAPAGLTDLTAAVLSPGEEARRHLLALARPGVTEEAGLQGRALLLDALVRSPAAPLEHAATGDSPAHVVSRALLADPANGTGLAEWSARLHVSPKTLQRDIERTFGVPFTALRTQIRLRAAIAHLHTRSVTETAHLVGYASASAFVAAFTRAYGESPGRYVGTGGSGSDSDSGDIGDSGSTHARPA